MRIPSPSSRSSISRSSPSTPSRLAALHLRLVPARQREQLAGERGAALGAAVDLLDRAAQARALRQLVEEHLAVTEDRGEHGVEIVGDAASEPSDRLHLLRLPELLLELLAAR